MQLRYQEIYQLAKSIKVDEKEGFQENHEQVKLALAKFCVHYEQMCKTAYFGPVIDSCSVLREALSAWNQEFIKKEDEDHRFSSSIYSPKEKPKRKFGEYSVPQKYKKLMAMLEFMSCLQQTVPLPKNNIKDSLLQIFQSFFIPPEEREAGRYHPKSCLKEISLEEKGLLFHFTSPEAENFYIEMLKHFDFSVKYKYKEAVYIPHNQIHKLFAIVFNSDITDLIKAIHTFYTEGKKDWKLACESTATPDTEISDLSNHFQFYFFLNNITEQIFVEFTTLGCVFFIPSGRKEFIHEHFKQHQLETTQIVERSTFADTFHAENKHLSPQFNASQYKEYLLILPDCLNRLLYITGFAPSHHADLSVQKIYRDRNLEYNTVMQDYIYHLIQTSPSQKTSMALPSVNDDPRMNCTYAEIENEVLVQWRFDSKAERPQEMHVIILLDNVDPFKASQTTLNFQREEQTKKIHAKARETCISIIQSLPDNVVISLYVYGSDYPTLNSKKPQFTSYWKDNVDFIPLVASDSASSNALSRLISEKKVCTKDKLPHTIFINITKDCNVAAQEGMMTTLQSALKTIQIPYIPIIIGEPAQTDIRTIDGCGQFSDFFVVGEKESIAHKQINIAISKTIAPKICPTFFGVASASVSENKETAIFAQPERIFIRGASYHFYSRIPKALFRSDEFRFIVKLEGKITISLPTFSIVTEPKEVQKLQTACSQPKLLTDSSPRFLSDDIHFETTPAPKNKKKPTEQSISEVELDKKNTENDNDLVIVDNNLTTSSISNTRKNVVNIIKRLFSLSTTIQLIAFLILLGLVLSSGYGALIITGLVTLSIGLVSQLIINYLDHQNWQQNVKHNPAESYIGHEMNQLIPSSIGGKCLMGLGIVASIVLLGFCIGFMMGDPICVSLLAPIFNAMHHFLLNGMLDINLSGIPAEIIEIVSKTMCTLFLSTIPLVAMLIFKSVREAVMGCTSISESSNNTTEDLLNKTIDHSHVQPKTGDLFEEKGSSTVKNMPPGATTAPSNPVSSNNADTSFR